MKTILFIIALAIGLYAFGYMIYTFIESYRETGQMRAVGWQKMETPLLEEI